MINNLTPQEEKKFTSTVREIVDAMIRQDGETDLIKEICKQNKEKFGIETKDTRKVAKLVYDQAVEEERQRSEDVFDLAERVMNNLYK